MARKQKVESKDKMELAQKYLKGEISQGEGQRLAGVAKSTFQDWIKRYESEGSTGFETDGANRIYDEKLKKQAVAEYLESGLGQGDTLPRTNSFS